MKTNKQIKEENKQSYHRDWWHVSKPKKNKNARKTGVQSGRWWMIHYHSHKLVA
jgi:hypothetical protein